MVLGRLFGDVDVPPVDPTKWAYDDNHVYGCALCKFDINSDQPQRFSKIVVNGGKYSVQREYDSVGVYGVHGPVVNINDLAATGTLFSICVSAGHIYIRRDNITSLDDYTEVKLTSNIISILNHDLPPFELVYYHGSLYNRSAVIVDKTEGILLSGLSLMNHRLKKIITTKPIDVRYYNIERDKFIHDLDDIISTDITTRDTEIGLNSAKLIVRNTKLIDTTAIPFSFLSGSSAFGKVYKARINNEFIIYKYTKIDRNTRGIVNNEKSTSLVINENKRYNTRLPYPYTFSLSHCESLDITNLKIPKCGTPTSEYGVELFVQEYIDTIGDLHHAITTAKPNVGMKMIIEAIATLAEAHQGDTVKRHFMHMDAHSGNFLVSLCNDRTCSLDNSRTTRFGDISYTFGEQGFKIYLIDFGFTYIIDGKTRQSFNGDYPHVIRGLLPAIDFITLVRGTVPYYGVNLWKKYVRDRTLARRWNVFEKLLRLITALITEHTVALMSKVSKNVRFDRYTYNLRDVKTPVDMIQYIGTLARLSVDDQRGAMLDLADHVINKITGFTLSRRDIENDFVLMFGILCGAYITRGYRAREIMQTNIPQLSRRISERLGIRQVPKATMTGIPLFLWYWMNLVPHR